MARMPSPAAKTAKADLVALILLVECNEEQREIRYSGVDVCTSKPSDYPTIGPPDVHQSVSQKA